MKIGMHKKDLTACIILALAVLGILGECLKEVSKVHTTQGFGLDDAWIHASIAKNLISGHGFGINSGEWIPLSTAPAWTLLMAGFMAVFRDPVLSTMIAAFCCQVTSVILAYFLLLRLTQHRFWSFFGAVLLTLNPILHWGFPSGMEHPVVVLSIMLMLFVYDRYPALSRGRLIGMPLALLLGVLARPELFVVVPLAILATAYQAMKSEGGSYKTAVRGMIISSSVFLVGIAPYFAFNYTTTGHPFPTSFFVKTALRDVGFAGALIKGDHTGVWEMIKHGSTHELIETDSTFLRMDPFMMLLVPIGIVSFFKPFREKDYGRGVLMLLLVIVLPLFLGVVAPSEQFSNYANRYLTPMVPGVILLGSLGMWLLWSRCRQRVVAGFCLVMILHFVAKNYDPIIEMYGRDVRNTNRLYVQSGQWIADNIDPAETLAINDIGGISYFCENPVIDVMGLASPEIWPYLVGKSEHGHHKTSRARAIEGFLQERDIKYLVISPHYYPSIDRNTNVFEKVMQWDAAYPTHRSIDPQILYRIHWENYKKPDSGKGASA